MPLAILVVFAVALAACTSATPPAPTIVAVPEMRGSWQGTWAGSPVDLLVIDQRPNAGSSGVYVGTVQVLGQQQPGLGGVLTSQIGKRAVSARARGWLGEVNGRLTVLVRAEHPDGTQTLTLRLVADDRLEGEGESSFRWGPTGSVRLIRATR